LAIPSPTQLTTPISLSLTSSWKSSILASRIERIPFSLAVAEPVPTALAILLFNWSIRAFSLQSYSLEPTFNTNPLLRDGSLTISSLISGLWNSFSMNFLIPASCSSDGASTYVRTAELSFCSGVFSSSVKALYTSSNKLTSLLSHKSCKKFLTFLENTF